MSYHLCSSPSSVVHDRHPLSPSLKQLSKAFKRNSLSFPSRLHLPVNHVSLQDSIAQEPHAKNASTEANQQSPGVKSASSTERYVWVNPKNPRASLLRQKSYDSRYASLIKLAESLDSCDPIEDVVFGILSGLGVTMTEQDAVVVINNMSNPETVLFALRFLQESLDFSREVVIYNVTLKVFRKAKDLDGAEKLFDEMVERGVKPDNVTFLTLISCARICGMPNKAVEWFEKMASFGCEPDDVTYSAMIDAYGRAGDVDKALSLYDRARTERWRIDLATFATLIRIYGMSGNFDGCLNLYQEMKALHAKPNLGVYNGLLDAMGKAKRPWQATKIYEEMIKNGLSPNFTTYAALLRAYSRARYGEDALKVYKEMKGKGMEMSVVLYNTVLAMCADIGLCDEAVMIFEDLKNSENCKPDSWTFSSVITAYSCSGKVSEAELTLNEMLEAGFDPNLFVLTSLIQCYGSTNRTDDVVRTFNRVLELGITPDDRFCGCLLNVMTQTPKEELGKLTDCIEKLNSKLANLVNLLVEEQSSEHIFKNEASILFDSISADVKKAYCNCLIDLCVKLNKLEKACELLDLGLRLDIYTDIQLRSPTQWSLHLKSLSLGAALTALHVWINDLSKALESGDELPPLLGINTGHGKHKYSDKGLAGAFDSHLKELNAPFHEAPDKVGWFLTTKVAAQSWLESRNQPELVAS
ncbi:pentatricopeptide repeat-containing protein [Tripterygium wilfordii]|uniref:Pentatricopeptide repeat-containing protein n=1 Tax=Tripterygium wilfordii TaxID=458696 RepID=A0A7J7D967_TRIWF|nr:pentatricopeptide repeat-containing protein At4g16390, chloroplastic [Tripterygium wilfordii]KAF5742844.1 pentatricopeptide repeat-containing protein [Tripterygium wilfordii]